MSSSNSNEVTKLLHAVGSGDSSAQDQLFPLIYDELRAIASNRLGPGGGQQTLGTTALVHEAFIKLFDRTQVAWSDRSHFFKVAAMAMRQIVIDRAREHLAARRGGGAVHVDIDAANGVSDASVRAAEEAIDLDRALGELEAADRRLGDVVLLRFFGGLSVDETAEALGVTGRTVRRDWRRARIMLHDRLEGGSNSSPLGTGD